jgi:UDP-N-acetylmuramyl pentapeptide synthase
LLRRGLAVTDADAALITNIAEDHFGDFASQSLDELLDIKWIVSHAVAKRGTLVLNADDALLVARSKTHAGRIDWFSMDAGSTLVERHTKKGGRAFVLSGEELGSAKLYAVSVRFRSPCWVLRTTILPMRWRLLR